MKKKEKETYCISIYYFHNLGISQQTAHLNLLQPVSSLFFVIFAFIFILNYKTNFNICTTSNFVFTIKKVFLFQTCASFGDEQKITKKILIKILVIDFLISC